MKGSPDEILIGVERNDCRKWTGGHAISPPLFAVARLAVCGEEQFSPFGPPGSLNLRSKVNPGRSRLLPRVDLRGSAGWKGAG